MEKPIRRGKEKRHRFFNFKQKLETVDIDIFRSSKYQDFGREITDLGSHDSHFFQYVALLKQNEPSPTLDAILEEVFNLSKSLNLLLYHHKDIIAILLNHLVAKKDDITITKALHRLLASLCKDLRQEVYALFFPILQTLISTMNTTSEVLLESLFSTLCFLFKYHIRQAVQDFTEIFKCFKPLIAHKKQFVRQFAAESLSYLIRKLSKEKMAVCIAFVFKTRELETDENKMEIVTEGAPEEPNPLQLKFYLNGITQLLFQSVKGLRKRLNSSVNAIIPLALGNIESDRPDRMVILESLFTVLAKWCDNANRLIVWNLLFGEFMKLTKRYAEGETVLFKNMTCFLSLVNVWIDHNEELELYKKDFISTLSEYGKILASEYALNGTTAEGPFVKLSTIVLSSYTNWDDSFKAVVSSLFHVKNPPLVLKSMKQLLSHSSFSRIFLSPVIEYCELYLAEYPGVVLSFVAEMMEKLGCNTKALRPAYPTALSFVPREYQNVTPNATTPEFLKQYLSKFKKLRKFMELVFSFRESCENEGETMLDDNLQLLDKKTMRAIELHCLRILTHLWVVQGIQLGGMVDLPKENGKKGKRKVSFGLLDEKLLRLFNFLKIEYVKQINREEGIEGELELELGATMDCIASSSLADSLRLELLGHFKDIFLLKPHSVPIVVAFRHFLETTWDVPTLQKSDLYTLIDENVIKTMIYTLSVPSPVVRYSLQQILQKIHSPTPHLFSREIIELCIKIETFSLEAHHSRTIASQVLQIGDIYFMSKSPGKLDFELATNALLGVLCIRFTPLWEPTKKILGRLEGADLERFWNIFFSCFNKIYAIRLQTNIGDFIENESKKTEKVVQPEKEVEEEVDEEEEEHRLFKLSKETAQRDNESEEDSYGTLVQFFESLLPKLVSPIPPVVQPKATDTIEALPMVNLSTYNDALWDILFQNPSSTIQKITVLLDMYFNLISKYSTATLMQKGSPHNALLKFFNLIAKIGVTGNEQLTAKKKKQLFASLLEWLGQSTGHVQSLTLDGMLKFEDERLKPYEEKLKMLMDDKSYNKLLSGDWKIEPEESGGDIKDKDRELVIKLIISILYPKMFEKSFSKGKALAKRNVILRFFLGLQEVEFDYLISLLMTSLKPILDDFENDMEVEVTQPTTPEVLFKVPANIQKGFLNTLKDLMKTLGTKLSPKSLDLLLQYCLSIALNSERILQGPSASSIRKNDKVTLTELRSQALLRISLIFEYLPPNHKPSQMFIKKLFGLLNDELKRGISDNSEQGSALISKACLKVMNNMSNEQDFGKILFNEGKVLIENVLKWFAALKGTPPQAELVFNLVENLVRQSKFHGLDIITQHLDILLDSLQGRLVSLSTGGGKSVKKNHFVGRVLSVLSEFSRLITTTPRANSLMDLIFPLLRQKRLSDGIYLSLLSIIETQIGLVSTPVGYVPFLGQLFDFFQPHHIRIALCRVFEALSKRTPSLVPIIPMLYDINADTSDIMQKETQDRRFKVLTQFVEGLHATLNRDQLLPLLWNFIFYLKDEFAVRSICSHGISLVIRRVKEEENNEPTKGKENAEKVPLLGQTLVTQTLLPVLRKHLHCKEKDFREEYLKLVAEIILLFPALYPDIYALVTGEETNFFTNIVHMQSHRRARSLVRLNDAVEAGRITIQTFKHILYPILFPIIIESHLEDHVIVEECTKVFVSFSLKILNWITYLDIIGKLRDLLARANEKFEKRYVSVLSKLLDCLPHFLDASEGQDILKVDPEDKQEEEEEESEEEEPEEKEATNENATEEAEKEEEDGKEQEEDDKDINADEPEAAENVKAEEGNEKTQTKQKQQKKKTQKPMTGPRKFKKEKLTHIEWTRASMENFIYRKFVCELQKHVKGKKTTEAVGMSSALAIVKLLKVMKTISIEHELTKLLRELTQHLRSKTQLVREIARTTLINILKSLGPSYFHYILTQLRGYLTRGYQIHVLGYTVHVVLMNMMNEFPLGTVDNSIPDLIEILDEEIFGKIGEQKEVSNFSGKMKETKKNRAFETFKLIAQMIDMGQIPSLESLLQPLVEKTTQITDSKTVDNIIKVFAHVQNGLKQNRSCDVATTLPFFTKLITDHLIAKPEQEKQQEVEKKLQAEREFNRPHKKNDSLIIPPQPRQTKAVQVSNIKKASNNHIIVAFGLDLVNGFLRNNVLKKKNEEHYALLKPIADILSLCLEQQSDNVIVVSLKIISVLYEWPEFSNLSSAEELLRKSFDFLQATNHSSPITAASFKAIATILRSKKNECRLSPQNLVFLLNHILSNLEDLENHQGQSVVFTVLKAILESGTLHPMVYDVMDRLGKFILQSFKPVVRENSRMLFVYFLINYPLGEKRLQQHLDFIMTNLNYYNSESRETLLSLLNDIFMKFPSEVLDTRAEYFFLPLVLSLVNDEDPKCRALVGNVIKTLFTSLSILKCTSLFDILISFLQKSSSIDAVQLGALQVFGMVLDVERLKMEKYLPTFLPYVKRFLLSDEIDISNTQLKEPWLIIYTSVIVLEKIMKAFPKMIINKELEELWEMILKKRYLLHEHTWIRLATARLFGTYFSIRINTVPLTDKSNDWFTQPGTIFKIAKQSCSQIESEFLNKELGTQITKNLIYLEGCLIKFPQFSPKIENFENEITKPQKEPKKQTEGLPPSQWILRRLTYMAKRMISTKEAGVHCIFQWIGVMTNNLPEDILKQYLLPMLFPLYVYSEMVITEETPSDIVENNKIAKEIMNYMKEKVGTPEFVQHYEQVMSKIIKKRVSRKQKVALEAVINPEAAARNKIKKNLAKKESKKRKFMQNHVPMKEPIKVRKLDVSDKVKRIGLLDGMGKEF